VHHRAVYRETLKQRQNAHDIQLAQRFEQAMVVAQRAADFLKQELGATRVMLFGSLCHRKWFSPSSDIDLAVWGLSHDDELVAIARLQDLSPDFKVDLVVMERCRSELAEAILSEGKEL